MTSRQVPGRSEQAGPPKSPVLVVEDHPINRKVLLRLLDQLGREGVAATDVPSALRALDTGGLDLVLLSLDIPGMDGLALAREIRRRESAVGLAPVPILALVGGDAAYDPSAMSEAGIDGRLARPITRKALGDAVSALGGAGPSRPPLDREALIDRCGGDAAFVVELLASFAESVVSTLGILRDAAEAGDLARLAEAAHGLKGIARTVVADPLADSAASLEDAAGARDLAACRSILVRVAAAWSELLPHLKPSTESPR